MKQHCLALSRDADLLGRHVEVFRSWVRDGRSFRSSQLKKQMELQNAPINLHYQFLVLKPVPTSSEDDDDDARDNEKGRRNTVFVDFVSVGACTTHGLGYKRGGLVTLEHGLVSADDTTARLVSFSFVPPNLVAGAAPIFIHTAHAEAAGRFHAEKLTDHDGGYQRPSPSRCRI